MKKIYILSAVLLAGLASCQNALEQSEEIVVPARTYTVSVNAVKGIDSKALAEATEGTETTLKATWGETDCVVVCDATSGIVLGYLYPSTTEEASTKLIGDITVSDPKVGDWLYLQYPGKVTTDPEDETKAWPAASYYNQDGTLATIANEYDYATAGFMINAIDETSGAISGGDDLGHAIEFYNRQAVVKFSLKAGQDALPVNSLKIMAPAGYNIAYSFWIDSYDNKATDALEVNLKPESSDVFVAIHSLGNGENGAQSYNLFAESEGAYYYATPAKEMAFEDGNYYRGRVSMTPVAYDSEEFDVVSTWTVIGALADYEASWDKDLSMWTDGHMHLAANVSLKAGDLLKFRNNLGWDENFGANISYVPSASTIYANGNNIAIDADGVYDLYLDIDHALVMIVPASDGGLVSTVVGEEPEPETVWSIVGEFNNWGGSDDIDMTLVEGKWVSPASTLSGDIKIRKNHDWVVNRGAAAEGEGSFIPTIGEAFVVTGGGRNINVAEGYYIVTYDPAEETILITAEDDVYIVAGVTLVNGELTDNIFGTDWDATNTANQMTLQQDGTYEITYEAVPANTELQFKVVKNNKDWYGYRYNDYNYIYTTPAEGDVTIKFNPAPEGEDEYITVVGPTVTKYVLATEIADICDVPCIMVSADDSKIFNGSGTYQGGFIDVPSLEEEVITIAGETTDIELIVTKNGDTYTITGAQGAIYAAQHTGAANNQETYINFSNTNASAFVYRGKPVGDENALLLSTTRGTSSNEYLYYHTTNKIFKIGGSGSSLGVHFYVLDDGRQKQSEMAFSSSEAEYDIYTDKWIKAVPELSGNMTSPVEYSSSDESVATVNPSTGVVTPLAKGTTTITAIAPESDTYRKGTASYTLNVIDSNLPKYVKATSVDAGESYLIVSNGHVLLNNNSSAGAAEVTVTDGVILYEAPATALWTAAESSGKYTFKNGSRSLGRSSSSVSLYSSSSFSYDSNEETLTVAGSTSTYHLYYSSGFKYSTSTEHAALYVLDGPKDRGLAFSAATMSADVYGKTASYVLEGTPTLTGKAGALDDVTYEVSGDSGVASVNPETGAVTLLLGTGTVTITASAGDTDKWKAGSASYELTVTSVAPSVYTLITETSELESGATYLIVSADSGNYNGKDHGSLFAGDQAGTAVDLEEPANNGVITGNYSAYEFVITASGDAYTLYGPNGYVTGNSGTSYSRYIQVSSSAVTMLMGRADDVKTGSSEGLVDDAFYFYYNKSSYGSTSKEALYLNDDGKFKIGGSGRKYGVYLYKKVEAQEK